LEAIVAWSVIVAGSMDVIGVAGFVGDLGVGFAISFSILAERLFARALASESRAKPGSKRRPLIKASASLGLDPSRLRAADRYLALACGITSARNSFPSLFSRDFILAARLFGAVSGLCFSMIFRHLARSVTCLDTVAEIEGGWGMDGEISISDDAVSRFGGT